MYDITTLEKINLLDDIFKPRTPNEYVALTAWASTCGSLSINLAHSDSWRSQCSESYGRIFCDSCDQMIPENYCRECGLPEHANLPTRSNLIPFDSDTRRSVRSITLHLLNRDVESRLALNLLQAFNSTLKFPMDSFDVENVFRDIAVELTQQRKQVGQP